MKSLDPDKQLWKILAFFFQIHDPTTPDSQGNDYGSAMLSYLLHQEAQKQIADKTIGISTASDLEGRSLLSFSPPLSGKQAGTPGLSRRHPNDTHVIYPSEVEAHTLPPTGLR